MSERSEEARRTAGKSGCISRLDELRNAEAQLRKMRREIDLLELRLEETADRMGVRSSYGNDAQAQPPQSTSRSDAPVLGATAGVISRG